MIATARREEVLKELAAELGERVETVVADLAEAADVAALPERAGHVDVLVANAALPASGALLDFEPVQIDRALDVNLRAPTQLARALAPAMVERGSGHLVFISSLSGKAANAGSALYSATKFGMRGMALRPARRPERDRSGRDHGVPGLHPRRRDVPRKRHRAAAGRGHAHARPGGRGGGEGRSSAT